MRINKAYITTEINHWNDIFRLNQRFMSNFVFRGQGNSDWQLKTSLARMVENHHPSYIDKKLPAIYEHKMMEEFKWKYPSYEKLNIPKPDEAIEWLSLMQHYGSPTRMLDFSYSMYVALFMAIDGSFFQKSAIWAINENVLTAKVFEKYRSEYSVNSVSSSELNAYTYKDANESINNRFIVRNTNETVKHFLYLTRPHLSNERINRQQGLFIIPSSIEVDFIDILKGYFNNSFTGNMEFDDVVKMSDSHHYAQDSVSVLKIEIPLKLKYGISNVLRQMNISSETMYPGVEGLARSMSCLRNGMGDYNED